MRKNFGPKSYLYPMPVLIIGSYNEDRTPNAMNAAWGCIADSDRIGIYVSAGHKTMENILKRKAFTVSMAVESQITEADYVGIVSGNKVADKLKNIGWQAMPSQFVDAPLFQALPMALECALVSFDPDTELLIGKILNVCAEEEILTEGKIDPMKLRPITYDPVNHAYLSLGAKVGNAFSDGKKIK